ncbi:UROD/MetE-like protein [Butyriboletus roseoflavus]|nr:UROD/MetE-like protein [Butyriboletus roseoflavus]
MAPKQTPPFRAEHIGSLLRPDYLLEARRMFDRREITREQLREIEDRAIKGAIDMQRKVGIKSFTDGEYRFYDGFFEYLEGFEEVGNPPLEIFKLYVPDIHAFTTNNTKPATTTLCTGKIKYVESGYIPQFEALKELVHPDEVKNIKITLAAPEWFHLRHGEHAFVPGVYTDREDYFNDIAAAYRQELEVLYAAGCRNVQIDDPLLAYFCDVSMLKGMDDEGTDADALLDAYIRLYNNCISTRPQDMTVGLHLCRGNFRHSMHFSEGGYDAIAVKLFNEVNVDCYYLEYDTERAGTFEPLRHLPKHKSLVLGLITSKFPELENKTLLRERVFDAARIVASGTGETMDEALKRISVSPQCGFASHEEGNLLTASDMEQKLQLVKDLAASIWTDA